MKKHTKKAKKSKKVKDEAPVLTGHSSRQLRALGHALDPVIAIGKGGITETLVKEAGRALLRHELIKVRVHGEAPVDRKEAGAELATATRSALAQVLGRTFLLYKPHPETPKIVLTKPKKAAAPSKDDASKKRPPVPLDEDDDGDFVDGGDDDSGNFEEPEE